MEEKHMNMNPNPKSIQFSWYLYAFLQFGTEMKSFEEKKREKITLLIYV